MKTLATIIQLLLSTLVVAAQCSNRWFVDFESGSGAVTTNALRNSTIGVGNYIWASFRSGVGFSIPDNTITFETDGQVPITGYSNICGTTINYYGLQGFRTLTDTNYNWRFIPSNQPVAASAGVWIKWDAIETDSSFNLDVFTFYPQTGTNFANADLVSLAGSFRMGFENPGGSTNVSITGLHSNTWYWLSLSRNVGGTNMMVMWDINMNLVGGSTSLVTTVTSISNLCIAINSKAATLPGYHIWYDDLLIDCSDAPALPILPTRSPLAAASRFRSIRLRPRRIKYERKP